MSIQQPGTDSAKPGNASRFALFEVTPTVRDLSVAAGVKHHRCAWAVVSGGTDYLRYHDHEWGVPIFEDRGLFEFLVLASAQTGLPWLTVLNKRSNYRNAFAGFDPVKVAQFTRERQAELMRDGGLVRNRLKIAAAIRNAQRFLEVQERYGSFAAYLWDYVDGRPVQNRFRRLQDVPASTELSDRISRDLRQRGFRFVGTKTVYAFLQAIGVVNDHLVGCFRHASVSQIANETPFHPDAP